MDALPAAWFAPDGASETSVPAAAAPPNVAAERALVAWADARGIRIALPTASKIPALTIDPAIADSVEKELISARDALTRQDVDATEHALGRASSLLRDHPELPQAAWLLAEVERGWAARWMRISPPDVERAARAWQRAAGLDGGRAAGIGETEVPKLADVGVTFSADDDDAATILVDGTAIKLGQTRLSPGEHAVVTKRQGHVVWASWVSVGDHEVVRVPVFRPTECSAEDLAVARGIPAKKSIDAHGVTCSDWIAASPVGASALRIARCEGEHCGPWQLWQSHAASLAPVLPIHRHPKPKVAGWVVVGAVVLAAAMITGVTLVAAGAFDGPPHETKFVGGGVKTSSLPIVP
ncbi:MAG: hypothetical protein ABI461_21060 [Polyangiaceae bacterium]